MNGKITWLTVNVSRFQINNDNVFFVIMETQVLVLTIRSVLSSICKHCVFPIKNNFPQITKVILKYK